MRKILYLLLFNLFIFVLPKSSPVHATNECSGTITATDYQTGKTIPDPPISIPGKPKIVSATGPINYGITVGAEGTYQVVTDGGVTIPGTINNIDYRATFKNTKTLKGSIPPIWLFQHKIGEHTLHVYQAAEMNIVTGIRWEPYGSGSCDSIGYEIIPIASPTAENEICALEISPETGITSDTNVTVSVKSKFDLSVYSSYLSVKGSKYGVSRSSRTMPFTSKYQKDDTYNVSFSADPPACPEYSTESCTVPPKFECNTSFIVSENGYWIKPKPTPTAVPTDAPFCSDCTVNNCAQTDQKSMRCRSQCRICIQKPAVKIPDLKPLCEQLETKYQDDCKRCVNSPKENPPGEGGIWSAIGCLPTDFSELIKKYVFTTGVGIAGGIAFIYFLYGAFLILTSSGNAEKMEEAKQIITSALAGLLLIIFSVFLLSVIGVQILQLPGFG